MREETRPKEPTRSDQEVSRATLREEEKREKEDEDEEEEEEEAEAQQAQGRALAQSGQREMRRSRRQIGQIPVERRLEGCSRHFQASSSSA